MSQKFGGSARNAYLYLRQPIENAMNKRPSLSNMVFDIWLLENLLKAGKEGLKLSDLEKLWQEYKHVNNKLSRTTFNRHREFLENMFQVKIDCDSRYNYYISNPEVIALDSLANDLLASMHEYLFLDEYRDLGAAIQPAEIWEGLMWLHPIGDAIRYHNKMRMVYQKFTEEDPEISIIHPYCLKADRGRWYVLAHKEQGKHRANTFALDRTKKLELLEDTFTPDPSIDSKTYFHNAFGIWVDEEHYPVRDIIVKVPQWVSKYWRTLPLHHSQKEIKEYKDSDYPRFIFHISPSPDFLSELKKWDGEIERQ